jgi:steroid delta-isomerase-like uncharacterized protein
MTDDRLFKRSVLVLIGLAIVSLVMTCQQPTDRSAAKDEEIKALVQSLLPIWNEQRLELIDEMVAPGYVRHQVDMGEDIVGGEALKEFATMFFLAFPDFSCSFDEIFVDGDTFTVQWTVTGTQTGPFQDLPPTGRAIKVSGVGVGRAADGKVVEEWNYWNELALMEQLGFTLTPPAEVAETE